MRIQSVKRILQHPYKILTILILKLGKSLSDATYIKILFYNVFGKKLNLKNPKTFNEKLQWLKLNYRNNFLSTMVDKIDVKAWIANRIGKEFVIPNIAVYENAEDIDFENLPDKFVLKCNHDCGGLCICTDKSKLNIDKVRKQLNANLKRDYYKLWREWPYKGVKRRILAEPYMVDESGYELKDYKIFCFNGIPEFIQVDFDRFALTGHKRNLYNTNWELLDFQYVYPSNPSHIIEKPPVLEKMLELASKISEGHPFLRVDFYVVNGKPYFGETTFFPESGLGKFTPESKDLEYGEKLKIDFTSSPSN